jgi:hypothetical protein
LLLDDRSSAVVDVVGFLAVETPGGPAGRSGLAEVAGTAGRFPVVVETPGGPAGISGLAETLALVEVFEKVGNGVENGDKVIGPVWKLAVIVGFFETLALVEVVDKVGNGPVGVLTLGRLAVIRVVGFTETLALVEVFEKVGNGVETGVKVYGPVWKLAVIVGFFETLALVEVFDKVGNGPVGVLTLGRLAVIVGFAVSTLQPVDTPS